MIRMIADILNIYAAMILYYVLKMPYGLRMVFDVAAIFLIMYFAFKLVSFLVKRCVLPILFPVLKSIIHVLQMIVFLIVKLLPPFQGAGSAFDDLLNSLGIKLEERQSLIKVKKQSGGIWKKIWKAGFGISLAAVIVFVVIPYYMEPSLTGNAKEICARFNRLSAEFEGNIYRYVNQYYTPKAPKKTSAHDQKAEEESQESRKYILHLGKEGYAGANLRSTPEIKKDNIIKAVSGNIELIYENETQYDGERVWLKVSTEDVKEAWISRKLIREEDLEAAGIIN